MELRISISEKHLAFILVSISVLACIGLVVAYGGSSPSVMGHTWGEMECPGCITSVDVNFNYAGSDSKGGKATSAATADSATSAASAGSAGSVPWGGVTGMPAEIANDDDYTTCSWSGWTGATGCLPCSGWRETCETSIVIFELYCSGGKITQARTTNCCVHCMFTG